MQHYPECLKREVNISRVKSGENKLSMAFNVSTCIDGNSSLFMMLRLPIWRPTKSLPEGQIVGQKTSLQIEHQLVRQQIIRKQHTSTCTGCDLIDLPSLNVERWAALLFLPQTLLKRQPRGKQQGRFPTATHACRPQQKRLSEFFI